MAPCLWSANPRDSFLDGAKLTEAEIEELKNILDRQGK